LETSQSVVVRSSVSRAKSLQTFGINVANEHPCAVGRESPSNFSTDADSAGRYQDALPH
jgi:hypothetical protein